MKELTLILILAIVSAFALIVFLMASGKTRQSHYLEKIIYLEAFIQTSKIDLDNFYFIYSEFEEINRYDCDRERTQRAFKLFTKRYISEWLDMTVRGNNPKYMEFYNQMIAI